MKNMGYICNRKQNTILFMKKLILQLLSTAMMLGMCLTAFAQHSYLTADGVAVFFPKDFDAAQHLPSPIFLRELVPTGTVPASWQLRPQFSTKKGSCVATILVGDDVVFYGTDGSSPSAHQCLPCNESIITKR